MASTLKEQAKRFLANVPEQYVFKCCDGRILKNLPELRDCLHSMTDETFAYHVNERRNDFSTWVRDVIGDEDLATYLDKSLTKTQAWIIVLAKVAFLSALVGNS